MDPSDIPGRAIFVKLNEYKDILELMNALKDKLEQAKGTLDKIKGLKTEEETELELWQNSIGEIARKVDYIDKTLFEPESPGV
jgi:hypothetical protein